MTQIASVRANLSDRRPATLNSEESKPIAFTRKPPQIAATAKDKAIISPAALALELNTQFPNAGRYHFQFGSANEMPSRLERFPNGTICISGAGDRVVTIRDGVIVDRYDHVVPDDISAFLNAAKNAR